MTEQWKAERFVWTSRWSWRIVQVVFPFDFGYVPATRGDGDPLDVLVLMDEPTFVGCLVLARMIGVIEADQTEAGTTTRNDRVIAVAATSRNHRDVQSLDQLSANLVREIEHFFVSYNDAAEHIPPLDRSVHWWA